MSEPPDVWRILREPFPPEQIGQLSRVTCNDCREAQFRVCSKHTRIRCDVCKQSITSSHIHLPYVGHAAVTDRLLKADPHWTWEPAYRNVDPQVLVAAAATGNPEVLAMVMDNATAITDNRGGMWIKLTVGDVTRLGYGNDDDRGPDHDKKVISDAIRNAAMRFGVALDLWSKEDLLGEPPSDDAPEHREPETPAPLRPGSRGRDWAAEARACTDWDALNALARECNAAGAFTGGVRDAMVQRRLELTPTDQGPALIRPTSVEQ